VICPHCGKQIEQNPLSEREQQVLRLAAQRLTEGQMARRLSISVHTVRRHLANVYAKVDAHCRTEAVVEGIRRGWIEVEPYQSTGGGRKDVDRG
jgi:DNA-binding CsgD family transcriptional regulator